MAVNIENQTCLPAILRIPVSMFTQPSPSPCMGGAARAVVGKRGGWVKLEKSGESSTPERGASSEVGSVLV